MPALDIVDSGLMSTIDTGNVELTVTDTIGFESTDTAALLYSNALPIVIDAMGTELLDLSMQFTANFDDPDLIVNGLITAFEMLELEISLTNIFGSGFITGMGTSLMDTIDRATLEGILGGGAGTYTLFANVRDKAGASAALSFDIALSDPGVQPIPVPATGALFALTLAGLALRRRRT